MIQSKPAKIRNRQVGQIRARGSKARIGDIKDLTVQKINLYDEMKCIGYDRTELFERYQQIIHDLQEQIQQLKQRNYFLQTDRSRLLQQNTNLHNNIQQIKQNFNNYSTMQRKVELFEIINDEDTIEHVFHNEDKNGKQFDIFEQSNFELGQLENGHYLNERLDKKINLDSPENTENLPMPHRSEQQRTPCLNNLHTIIQCKSITKQSSIRLFYLLMLQDSKNFGKFSEILSLQHNPIFPLYTQGNEIWIKILQDFIDQIFQGAFQNEREVIEFIHRNQLIDILMVSCLKNVINIGQGSEFGQDATQMGDDLYYSRTTSGDQYEIIFRKLANQFQLEFQQDKERLEYRFYQVNQKIVHRVPSDQQMLLSSREIQRTSQQQLQISLHPQPSILLNGQIVHSRQEPLFKIRYDRNRSCYQTQISIRNDRDGFTTSFNNANQDNQSLQSNEALSEENYNNETYNNLLPRAALVQRDCYNNNVQKKYNQNGDFLMPKSMEPSRQNSCNEEY